MFCRPRIIPCLTMINRGLVKTIKFEKPRYIGDPINTIKIFNDKGVDELCILDIRATIDKRGPDFEYLKSLASEAFMPLSYGGGITSLTNVEKLFSIGFEKVVINSAFVHEPNLIYEAAQSAGSQSIVVSIDVNRDFWGRRVCFTNAGKTKANESPLDLARKAQELGAGEILLNSIEKDGTMLGYDIDLVKLVANNVSIPVVACGGAGKLSDIKKVLDEGGAHAAAAGSYFIYYGTKKAVLITVPTESELIEAGIYADD